MRYKQYCKDYENIENYDKALKDDFKGWQCHHRLETHNSDGERRLVDITKKELKALNMYYNRPSDELIFMTTSEHIRLHHKGKHRSEEAKNKMREAMKGKPKSEETKNKIREARKGKCLGKDNPFYGRRHTEESKKKMREARKGNKNVRGTRWYNNGKINKRARECPPGFVPGILK